MASLHDVEHFYALNRAAWRAWLSANHHTEKAVWVIYDKGPQNGISYNEIVEEALCFGWIDSVSGKVDDKQTKLYISVRKPKSAWSKSNKQRVEMLTEAGLIMPAGKRAIQIAKENGAWDALNKSDAFEQPPELIAAFKKDPLAKANYEAFSNSSKRVILEWLYSAKRPETLARRVEQTVTLAHNNIKANQ